MPANPPITVEMLADFAAAWNRHDLDALLTFMTEDGAFHAVAGPDLLGRSFVGTAALREGFALAWQTFPDASWTDGVHVVCGDRGISECTFTGTRACQSGGRPVTGPAGGDAGAALAGITPSATKMPLRARASR